MTRTLPLLPLLALLIGTCPAWGANERNTVYVAQPTGAPTLTESTTAAVSVQSNFNDGSSSSRHVGEAYAPTQTLRALTDLRGLVAPVGVSAKTEVGFSKEVTVALAGGGVSALPVPVTISLQLDGLSLGATQGAYGSGERVLTSVDTSLRYRVFDLDEQVCNEGCRPLMVAEFSYGGRLIYDYNYGGSGTADIEVRHGWSGFGLTSGSFASPYVNDYRTVAAASGGFAIDTGLLTLSFESMSGHRLLHTATLDTFVQTYGRGRALGDFVSTFDAGLSSTLAGVSFLGETPGVFTSAVPEPAGIALWLGGLAGLAAWRRHGRAASR